MKSGLQNYVIIMPFEKCCDKFNNKLNNLQRYNTAHYRILHSNSAFTSKCCTIAMLKSCISHDSSRGNSVSIVFGYGRSRFDPRQRQEMFLYSLSPPSLLSNRYPQERGKAQLAQEPDHSLPSSA
jgi:hypothetical protein